MNLTAPEAQHFTLTHRCGDGNCGAPLLAPWALVGGKRVHQPICSKDADHRLFVPKNFNIRKMYNPETKQHDLEVDVMSQEPVATITPRTTDMGQMQVRVQKAISTGTFPKDMTKDQQLVISNIAVGYGLDPLMGELMIYQGHPFITIAGRRRLDAVAGHKPGIKFRFLADDEYAGYLQAGVIEEGDLVQVCVLTREEGLEIEAFGKVTQAERHAKSSRGGLRSPVVAANPIEMCQKRAERRAREMAYGPVPMPERLDTVAVLQEGDESGVIESTGEIVDAVSAPPKEPIPKPENDPEQAQLCPHGMRTGVDECEQGVFEGIDGWPATDDYQPELPV